MSAHYVDSQRSCFRKNIVMPILFSDSLIVLLLHRLLKTCKHVKLFCTHDNVARWYNSNILYLNVDSLLAGRYLLSAQCSRLNLNLESTGNHFVTVVFIFVLMAIYVSCRKWWFVNRILGKMYVFVSISALWNVIDYMFNASIHVDAKQSFGLDNVFERLQDFYQQSLVSWECS